MQLQLEVTNHCNARCVFCPHPTMKRPKGVMDLRLFRRIVDEAATIPIIDHVTLTGLGETLMDPHIAERVAIIRSIMPAVLIDLYTNGAMLTPARVDALHEAGLSVLYVSLNAVNADRRKRIMGLDDFDRVVEGIEYAMTKPGWKVFIKGIVSKDLMEAGDNDAFTERWGGPTMAGGHAFLHLEGNWAGAMWPMRLEMHEPCARALGQLMVLWDGRMSLCCFDAEGACILGDLNTQTVREVFDHDPALSIRRSHVENRRADVPLCTQCTGI